MPKGGAGAGGERYTAYSSLDGRHWDKGATWTQASSANTKIGLISMGGAGFSSNFDYVRVSAAHFPPTASGKGD